RFECCGRHHRDLDQQRRGGAYVDIRYDRLEFRNGRAGWYVFVHLPDARPLRVSLHDSPRNGRNRRRSVTVTRRSVEMFGPDLVAGSGPAFEQHVAKPHRIDTTPHAAME